MFKVFAGSFKSRENAQERVAFLRKKGIQSFIVSSVISGETWFRVQAGAFSTRQNAEMRITEIKSKTGISAFISTDTIESPGPSTPRSILLDPSTIIGPVQLSAEKMNQYVRTLNPNAPLLGNFYKTLGEYYEIRGDVAFAQAMLETNYFRYTGDVRNGQNNFAGIGATGGGTRGASFETAEEGVLAHLQHLYAYATKAPLPNRYPIVDPRFHLVNRGSATTWTALNGKWAVPGTSYGQSILNLYKRMAES
jgi:hypothetical protein